LAVWAFSCPQITSALLPTTHQQKDKGTTPKLPNTRDSNTAPFFNNLAILVAPP
jgi:hypothetical protein